MKGAPDPWVPDRRGGYGHCHPPKNPPEDPKPLRAPQPALLLTRPPGFTSSKPWTRPTCARTERAPDPPPSSLQIRIWARPSATAAGHGLYALNVTGRILNFFAQHYNTPYPLDKSGE